MKTLFKLFAALAVLVAIAVARPTTAEAAGTYSVVVKFDGIDGDSRAVPGGIDVLSYSWSVSIANVRFGGGGGAGRPEFTPFNFVHSYDRASPKLFVAAAQGQHFRKVEFFVYRTGGKVEEKVLAIRLEDVLISSVSVSGHSELPTQNVALHYGKITWEYSKDGNKGSGGWDVPGNKGT